MVVGFVVAFYRGRITLLAVPCLGDTDGSACRRHVVWTNRGMGTSIWQNSVVSTWCCFSRTFIYCMYRRLWVFWNRRGGQRWKDILWIDDSRIRYSGIAAFAGMLRTLPFLRVRCQWMTLVFTKIASKHISFTWFYDHDGTVIHRDFIRNRVWRVIVNMQVQICVMELRKKFVSTIPKFSILPHLFPSTRFLSMSKVISWLTGQRVTVWGGGFGFENEILTIRWDSVSMFWLYWKRWSNSCMTVSLPVLKDTEYCLAWAFKGIIPKTKLDR